MGYTVKHLLISDTVFGGVAGVLSKIANSYDTALFAYTNNREAPLAEVWEEAQLSAAVTNNSLLIKILGSLPRFTAQEAIFKV